MNKNEILSKFSDSFEKEVASLLIDNEIGSGTPYQISHAGSSDSGWSFNWQQLDISKRPEAKALIKDIITNNYGSNSWTADLETRLTKVGDKKSLTKNDKKYIEIALNTDYAKEKLDNNFIKEIPSVILYIKDIEKQIKKDINYDINFTKSQQLMILDFNNQYNFGLNRNAKNSMLKKIEDFIQNNDRLSVDDLADLFRTTTYYNNLKESSLYKNNNENNPQEKRIIKTLNKAKEYETIEKVKLKENLIMPTNIDPNTKSGLAELSGTSVSDLEKNNPILNAPGTEDKIQIPDMTGIPVMITDNNGVVYTYVDGTLTNIDVSKQIEKIKEAVDNLIITGNEKTLQKIFDNPNNIDETINNLSDEEKNKIDTATYAKTKTDNLDTIKMVTYYSGFLPPLSYQDIDKLIITYDNKFNNSSTTLQDLKDLINNYWIKPIKDFLAEHKLYDPFVLDLNHDGIINTNALSETSSAFYDLDNDGFKEQTGWLDSSDGFLVDQNNNLFGINGSSGFNQLKLIDTNYDNKLDINDTDFKTLKVWRDDNQNGIVDEYETNTLEELNITEINLTNTAAHEIINGNTILAKSTFKQDNIDYLSADINFQINDTVTQYTTDYDLSSEEINLKGFGKIKDLNILTYENIQFKDWISTNLNTTSNIISNFDLFLKKWANITSPTKDSTVLSFSEKTWIVETFADKNGLKPYIEKNTFSDYLLNLRTSIFDKNEICLEYENLKINYMTQYLFQTILKDNAMGLSVNPDTNTIYIQNIYKFYTDLSNIINTKSNNEIILYLHMLKDNNLLNAVDLSLISPLIKDMYLITLFKENNFDHIISDLNKQITNNEIIVPINNIYANQFVYLENNKTTIKGQNKTTFLTKGINTITTEGFDNLFLLKEGSNTINSSKGNLVDIKSENASNTLTLTANALVNVDLKNSASTLVLNNNTMANITSDKGITLNNTNTYGTSNSIKINASIEDDNIYSKTAISNDIFENGGNNIYNLSFSKNLKFYGTGNNNLTVASINTTDINLKNGANTIYVEKAIDLNINLENSVSSLTLSNNTNQNIVSDKALTIVSSNVTAVTKSTLISSVENDDIYFKNIKDLSITDLGGTNKIKSSFVDLANIKTSNGVNNTLTLERILDLNLNIENSSNSILSFYGNTNTKVKSDSGLSLSVTSYQYENMIDLNLSEQKDLITIDREKQININDLGGDNNIKITNSINSNIKTGNGNDIITYKSTGVNVIEAGAGNDTITSNAGEDTFVFNKGNGNDVITNIGGVKDVVSLYNFVKDKVIFYFKGSDLVIGTEEGNSVTIKTQTTLNNQIEEVQLRNDAGSFKLDVNKLVQDMNAFTKTTGFSSTNEVDIRKNQALMNVFSSSWVGN